MKEIFLLEDDWEVALASISFPNMAATTETDDYKSLIGEDFPIGVEMSMDGVKDDDGNFIRNKSLWIKGQELLHEHDQQMGKPKDGVAFWNRLISLLNYRIYTRLSCGLNNYLVVGKDFQAKKPRWPIFTWQNIGDSARLFIDNDGIGGSCRSGIENAIFIYLDIAKAFNLSI